MLRLKEKSYKKINVSYLFCHVWTLPNVVKYTLYYQWLSNIFLNPFNSFAAYSLQANILSLLRLCTNKKAMKTHKTVSKTESILCSLNNNSQSTITDTFNWKHGLNYVYKQKKVKKNILWAIMWKSTQLRI